MNYITTKTGYNAFCEFSGEFYQVGIIHMDESIGEIYAYTDTLFNKNEIVLRHHCLSDLQDAISDYYMAAIEEKWI